MRRESACVSVALPRVPTREINLRILARSPLNIASAIENRRRRRSGEEKLSPRTHCPHFLIMTRPIVERGRAVAFVCHFRWLRVSRE